MHFAYDGFKQESGKRCFLFRRVEGEEDLCFFRIEIELALLARNRFSMQDGPLFCLQMLRSASDSGEEELDKLQRYQVGVEDFRSLIRERDKRELELRLKRGRRVPRTRSATSLAATKLLEANINRTV